MCLKADPSNAEAIYIVGLCSYFNGDLTEGLRHFEKANDINPNNEKIINIRMKAMMLKEKKEIADNLFKNKEFNKAIDFYTEALQIDLQNENINSKLYFNRALANSKIGMIQNSIADSTNTLKLSPNYLKARLLRAKCFSDVENYEKSICDYELAYELSKTPDIEQALKETKIRLKW